MNEFVQTLSSAGLPGMVAALVVLLIIFIAKKGGIVATGNQARFANVALGAITYGLSNAPEAEAALTALIASLLSALFYEGIQWSGAYISNMTEK